MMSSDINSSCQKNLKISTAKSCPSYIIVQKQSCVSTFLLKFRAFLFLYMLNTCKYTWEWLIYGD